MAVSMSAGFMRSDYMISDAAIPMRMEELEQLEQSAKFSEILGEFGNSSKNNVPETTDTTTDKAMAAEVTTTEAKPIEGEIKDTVTAVLSKAELRSLARAVVNGEVKLSELPEELVSEVLLMVVAMLMAGIPEDEIPALQEDHTITVTEVEFQAISEHVFLTVVPNLDTDVQNVPTQTAVEIPDELMAEVKSVVNRIIDAQEEIPADSEKLKAEDMFTQPKAEDVIKTATDNTAAYVSVNVTAEPVAKENSNVSAVKTDTATVQQTTPKAATQQVKVEEEFRQLKEIISEITVKKPELQQTAQQMSIAQTVSTDIPAKGRMVSKSDELALLKNSVKTVEAELTVVTEVKAETSVEVNVNTETESNTQNGADLNSQASAMMNAPQSTVADAPVVFTRADGTEVTVKPTEVIEQVVTNIVEQTTSAEGDTEYSVTLTPEDLGSITVKLTKAADGSLTVSITADNARTQRIIEENGLALQNSLRQNGIELESWQTVNESQQEARAQDYNGSSKNPYYREEDNSENADADDTSFAELISAM